MAKEPAKIFIYHGDGQSKPIVASIEVRNGEEVEDSRVSFNKGGADKWPKELVDGFVFNVLNSYKEQPSGIDFSSMIDGSTIYTVTRLP